MDGFIKKESYTLDFVTGVRLPETTLDLHTLEVQGGDDIQRQEIIRRWQETGLLDGLTNNDRINIAELMEGQAARMLREDINQRIPLHDLELPIIRRVTARTLANDLVSVRPIGELRYNEVVDNQQTHQDEAGLHNYILNVTGDLITWRTKDTWSYESLYGSLIGIRMDMKPLRMLPKKIETLFDLLD